jgi:hypothetical protein
MLQLRFIFMTTGQAAADRPYIGAKPALRWAAPKARHGSFGSRRAGQTGTVPAVVVRYISRR